MTFDKCNMLVNSVHSSWCNHLLENKDNNYDISMTYNLCNHVKVSIIKRTPSKQKHKLLLLRLCLFMEGLT